MKSFLTEQLRIAIVLFQTWVTFPFYFSDLDGNRFQTLPTNSIRVTTDQLWVILTGFAAGGTSQSLISSVLNFACSWRPYKSISCVYVYFVLYSNSYECGNENFFIWIYYEAWPSHKQWPILCFVFAGHLQTTSWNRFLLWLLMDLLSVQCKCVLEYVKIHLWMEWRCNNTAIMNDNTHQTNRPQNQTAFDAPSPIDMVATDDVKEERPLSPKNEPFRAHP